LIYNVSASDAPVVILMKVLCYRRECISLWYMYVSGMYQRLVLVVIVSAPDALVVILMKVLCYCRVTFRLRRRLRGPSAISQSVVVKNRYVMIS